MPLESMTGNTEKSEQGAGPRPDDPPERDFIFRGAVRIPRTTGRKASSPGDLREGIAATTEECIIHHTYQYFSGGHILEYTNDFAQWAGKTLEAGALAEMLANIDPYSFTSVAQLREELLRVLDYYIENFPEHHKVLPGNEFHFIEAISFIFPIGLRARNLAEFLMAMKYVDPGSIYYHFYEARVRLGLGVDDFSKWVDEALQSGDLARQIRGIDPFMHNMEGIREHLVEILEEGLRLQMEKSS